MKKQVIVILIVSLLLLGLLGTGIYFGVTRGQAIGGGATLISVSNLEVLGEGERLLMTAIIGGGSDNFIIEFNKETLNSNLKGEGWEVDNGGKLELNLEKAQEKYPLTKNENEIFYSIIDENSGKAGAFQTLTLLPLIKECKARGFSTTIYAGIEDLGFWSRPNIHCFVTSEIATRGQISGLSEYNYEIEVKSGQDSDTLSNNNQVVRLDNVEVSFEGTLNSPLQISTVPYDVLFVSGRFQNLISTASVSFIGTSAPENAMSSCMNSRTKDYVNARSCMKQYTSNLDNIVGTSKNDQFKDDNAPIIKSINLETKTSNSGILTLDVVPTQYPLVRIIVEGEFLGLERLSGIPEITSCAEDIKTVSGRELTGKITVKNIGSQSGRFLFSQSCSNDQFAIFGNDITLDKGDSGDINLRIIATSDKTGVTESGTCTLKIEDKVSGESDSCTFNLEVEFSDIICVPSQDFCSKDGTQVLRCGDFGDVSQVIDTCSGNEFCSLDILTNEFKCIEKKEIDTGVIEDNGDDEIIIPLECTGLTTLKVKTGCGLNPLCWAGIQEPKTTQKCVVSSWVWLVAVLFIIVLVFITIILRGRK